MVTLSHILGMNARDRLYASLNSSEAKRFGFSKLRGKEFFKKHTIPVAELYAVITSHEDLRKFQWEDVSGGFAIKPSNGSAGKGVMVIKKRVKGKKEWENIEGHILGEEDLYFHAGNILDGQYSTWGATANVIIEERIPLHADLEPFVQIGTPDVRVIVFNNIPVMAMVRLPTRESGGRANLDQGAIALGIDMGTGKTMFGVSGKKKIITTFPDSHISAKDIQIPFWTDVLKLAVRAANSTGLRYMGADIFLHPEKGPMIAEVNAYPGLSIQLANRAGLRRRLQRIEGMEARNVAHAVKIGQALFAESYPSEGELDYTMISPKEEIEVLGEHKHSVHGIALMNTGREWSAIALQVAKDLGLADQNDVLWTQYVEGGGKEMVVEVKFKMKGELKTANMVVSKKLDAQKYIVHLGRRDLGGYLVDVRKTV